MSYKNKFLLFVSQDRLLGPLRGPFDSLKVRQYIAQMRLNIALMRWALTVGGGWYETGKGIGAASRGRCRRTPQRGRGRLALDEGKMPSILGRMADAKAGSP